MGLFSSIGKGISSAVSAVGKVAGSVVNVAAPILGNLTHAVASNVPIVSNLYGAVTNLTGKDLRDVYGTIGDVASSVLQGGVGALKDVPGKLVGGLAPSVFTTNSDTANADIMHDLVQLNDSKTGAFAVPDMNNSVASYNGLPVVNGVVLTPSLAESSYDTNPILLPAVVGSGATDNAMMSAVARQGIDPAVVQTAISGVPATGKTTLESILDMLGGTVSAAKDAFVKNTTPVPGGSSTNNNKFLILVGLLLAGGAVWYFSKKR